MEIIKLHTQW